MDEYLRDLLEGPNGQFASLLLGIDAEKDETYRLVRETPAYAGMTGQPETWSDVTLQGTLEECLAELDRIVTYEGAKLLSAGRARCTDGTKWTVSRV